MLINAYKHSDPSMYMHVMKTEGREGKEGWSVEKEREREGNFK